MASVSDIDAVLRRAVEAGEVPGVVALAATDRGILYEGAFGQRDIARRAGDDARHDLSHRLDDQGGDLGRGDAIGRSRASSRSTSRSAASCRNWPRPTCCKGSTPSGKPRLRPAKRPITLRHLLTHTAGFGYEMLNSELIRYIAVTHTPSTSTGELASLRLPLLFDPGEKWQYGISIDWVGRAVEAASGQPLDDYFRDHIFAPLGMSDSGFAPSRQQRERLVRVHRRKADGSLEPIAIDMPPRNPEFWAGGGALYSTGPDYLNVSADAAGRRAN